MKRIPGVLAACVLVVAAAGQARADTTIFHDSFDTYTAWPDGGWQNGGTLLMDDRGGGDKFLYSPGYTTWGMPFHSTPIDWANVDTVTLTTTVRSLGCRTWVGLTRNTSPTEETFYLGEYGTSPFWGIKWNGVSYPSGVSVDSNWHVLSMVVDQPLDKVDLFIDGGADPIVTVNGLGTDYLNVANVCMRIQKHGTYSQVSDVLLQTGVSAPPPPTYHPGDANKDGLVNLEDFGLLKDNFGATADATWAMGDFNADGAINLEDFGILKDHFGHTTGDTPLSAVPEPASLVLLAACGFAIPRRRR